MYYIEGQINPFVRKDGSPFTTVGVPWWIAIVFPILAKVRVPRTLVFAGRRRRGAPQVCFLYSLRFPIFPHVSCRCLFPVFPLFLIVWIFGFQTPTFPGKDPARKGRSSWPGITKSSAPFLLRALHGSRPSGTGQARRLLTNDRLWDGGFPHSIKTPLSTLWAAGFLGGTGSAKAV